MNEAENLKRLVGIVRRIKSESFFGLYFLLVIRLISGLSKLNRRQQTLCSLNLQFQVNDFSFRAHARSMRDPGLFICEELD